MENLLAEIPEGDRESLARALGDPIIPQDVAQEYFLRRQLRESLVGYYADTPPDAIVDLLRHLGYRPKIKKISRKEPVRWDRIPLNTPIICQSPDYPFPIIGLFLGFLSGIITVRSPHMPNPLEFYAKFTRLADPEEDDLSCLEDMQEIKDAKATRTGKRDRVFEQQERRDKFKKAVGKSEEEPPESVYEDEEPPETTRGRINKRPAPPELINEAEGEFRSEEEPEEHVYPWSDLHTGREVTADDGDLEFLGVIERTDEVGVYIRGGYIQDDGKVGEESIKMFHRRDVYDNSGEDVVVVSR